MILLGFPAKHLTLIGLLHLHLLLLEFLPELDKPILDSPSHIVSQFATMVVDAGLEEV